MKFAVIGAGGIGGYLGARLALAGESVTFIARGPNLQALRTEGIRLIEEDGTEHRIGSVSACQQISEAGEQDVVLLALKAHQVAAVAPQLSALLGPDTAIVTLQNGIPFWYFHGLEGPWKGHRLESVDPGGSFGNASGDRVSSSFGLGSLSICRPCGASDRTFGATCRFGSIDVLGQRAACSCQLIAMALRGDGATVDLGRELGNLVVKQRILGFGLTRNDSARSYHCPTARDDRATCGETLEHVERRRDIRGDRYPGE